MESRFFREAHIHDVEIKTLQKHEDDRGWLCELWRNDTDKHLPAMCYISITKPSIVRGPHEHMHQTDRFCFLGNATFLLVLWDNRKDSSTYNNRMKLLCKKDFLVTATIPNGVVHGYKNIDVKDGFILNLPDQLFKGVNREDSIDEFRYENNKTSPFLMDY